MKMSREKEMELDRLLQFLHRHQTDLDAIDHAAMQLYGANLPLAPALRAYAQYSERNPASPVAAYNHAWYLTRDGQFEAAIHRYERALELGIESPEEVYVNIGNIWMDHLLDDDRARAAFRAALELKADYFGAWYNLGNLEEQSGNREQATAHFKKCLEIEPDNHSVLARLADAHRFRTADDPLLARLQRLGGSSTNADLHFALGSAYDQLRDFRSAYAHFTRANALDRVQLPRYDRNRTETDFDRIIDQTGSEWLDRFAGESERHVFICGMFRTGSTLLEQMLDAHPQFRAVGESEFFPRLVMQEFGEFPLGLDDVTPADARAWQARNSAWAGPFTGGTKRLLDKRPDNFRYIGLIRAILPSAQFIVTERDWRDVALSIYAMRLGAGQNYATDLADIRHYIDQQRRLVDHWAQLLGPDLLRVRYEDLVTEPRETLGRVLDRLGEDWEERCLAFDKRATTVKTGSVWQVRQPLHSRSIGRWKNYRPYFESAFGADLGD